MTTVPGFAVAARSIKATDLRAIGQADRSGCKTGDTPQRPSAATADHPLKLGPTRGGRRVLAVGIPAVREPVGKPTEKAANGIAAQRAGAAEIEMDLGRSWV